MISLLQGTIQHINEQSVILLVSNIGFEIFVPNVHSLKLNQTVTFFISLHWNQEQGPSLFGFLTEADKAVFLMITKCHGIGPKLALSILHHIPVSDFLKALQKQDYNALQEIPGIGRKKAEQLVIELKDKVNQFFEKFNVGLHDADFVQWKELSQVLTSLNYSKQEINEVLQNLKTTEPSHVPFDQLLRKSLSLLSQRKHL